ncbi:SIS domain-containing protein, partial [[Ruminococcus] torques]|uniref:SIS domain-containing protein n=1 Tax=[Ruminococcus] torques TaxID=33039 RepID=UPI001AD7ECB8
MLVKKIQRYLDLLIDRYPQLLNCKEDIEKAYLILEECYENDHKLLIAGNGGSAADSEHIAGELMKRFKIQRSIPSDFAK